MSKKLSKEVYNSMIDQSIRNIDITGSDMNGDLFTKSFFDRTDISQHKKDFILNLQNKYLEDNKQSK